MRTFIGTTLNVLALLFYSGCGLGNSRPDGSGTIECTQVRVSPEVAGRIVTLGINEGDVVRKGQIVAQLDTTNYMLKCSEARAASVLADQDLKRIQDLFARKSVSERQVDEARAMADQARARLAQMEKAVADCTVRAPMDGIVSVKSAEEGEMTAPGAVLFTLSRLDEVWLSVYVPEPRLSVIKLGRPAKIRVDGRKEKLTGVVTYISPVAEFSPKNVQTVDERAKLVFRVKVTVKNTNGVLKPGMPADAWLEAGE